MIHSRWESIPRVLGRCWLGKALCLTVWSTSPGHRILVNKNNRFYFLRLKSQISRLFSEQLASGLLCSVLVFSSICVFLMVLYKHEEDREEDFRKRHNSICPSSSKAGPARLLFQHRQLLLSAPGHDTTNPGSGLVISRVVSRRTGK